MNPSAGWFPDPLERHQSRYWDGVRWTDHVADGGDLGIDRLEAGGVGGVDVRRDAAWAEQIESAPEDATTIVAASSVVTSRPGPWRRFRALPVAVQGVAGLVVAGLVWGAAANGADDASVVAGPAEGATTTTVVRRITEVTSPPETTTTTVAPTTTAPTTTAPPSTLPPATTVPPTTTTDRTVATITPAPPDVAPRPLISPATTDPPTSPSRCHPSYEGTCIPSDVSDADCAGGGGDGPYYVQERNIRIVGPDPFRLDGSPKDGIGCEG